MIFGSARLQKFEKNTKRNPIPLKLCRIHIHIILSLPAKNQVKIPCVAWRTQLVPPRKNHVSSCPARKSSESSIGGVLPSAPTGPWLGWLPRPSRAHGACEGLGEGSGRGPGGAQLTAIHLRVWRRQRWRCRGTGRRRRERRRRRRRRPRRRRRRGCRRRK